MDHIRVAVVGTGILGSRHARVFYEQEDSSLVAVVDIDEDKARKVADAHGVRAYTDIDTMLSTEDIDAVAVATPDFAHRDPVIKSLDAGKHVFMEKPIATNLTEAREIAGRAESSRTTVMVNFSQRFMDEFSSIKRFIQEGQIGRPVMVNSTKFDTIFVPTQMISWADRTSPLFFMTSHDLDLIHWYLEADPVVVVAQEARSVLEDRGIRAHDGLNALILFEGGISSNFHSSWIHPNTYYSTSDGQMTIIGSEGVLTYDKRTRQVEVHDASGARRTNFSVSGTAVERNGKLEGAFTDSVRHFLSCIREDKEPLTSPRRTLATAEAQFAVLESLRTNEPVRIEKSSRLSSGSAKTRK